MPLEQPQFKIPSLEESLRVARAQYDQISRIKPLGETWKQNEKRIRSIYSNMAGMDTIQKQEYLRGMAENNLNPLKAMRESLDHMIANHPENKSGKNKKGPRR